MDLKLFRSLNKCQVKAFQHKLQHQPVFFSENKNVLESSLSLYLHTSIHTPIPKQRTDVSKYHNNDSADALWEMPCDTSVASAYLCSLFHEKKKVVFKKRRCCLHHVKFS